MRLMSQSRTAQMARRCLQNFMSFISRSVAIIMADTLLRLNALEIKCTKTQVDHHFEDTLQMTLQIFLILHGNLLILPNTQAFRNGALAGGLIR